LPPAFDKPLITSRGQHRSAAINTSSIRPFKSSDIMFLGGIAGKAIGPTPILQGCLYYPQSAFELRARTKKINLTI